MLEELGIPYTNKIYTSPELKQPAFLRLNRNGMTPVIEDSNTHLLLAEASIICDMYKQRLTCFSPVPSRTTFSTNTTPKSAFLSPQHQNNIT